MLVISSCAGVELLISSCVGAGHEIQPQIGGRLGSATAGLLLKGWGKVWGIFWWKSDSLKGVCVTLSWCPALTGLSLCMSKSIWRDINASKCLCYTCHITETHMNTEHKFNVFMLIWRSGCTQIEITRTSTCNYFLLLLFLFCSYFYYRPIHILQTHSYITNPTKTDSKGKL